jgi:hypothetical protein
LAVELPFSRKLRTDKHVESYGFPCLDVGSTPTISTLSTDNALIINRLTWRYFFGLRFGLQYINNSLGSSIQAEPKIQNANSTTLSNFKVVLDSDF